MWAHTTVPGTSRFLGTGSTLAQLGPAGRVAGAGCPLPASTGSADILCLWRNLAAWCCSLQRDYATSSVAVKLWAEKVVLWQKNLSKVALVAPSTCVVSNWG